MFVTVTLNPALDHVMQLDALRPGRTNRSHGERLQPGGKGINVAVVLCRLGADVAAWGFIAGFTGRVIADGVAALGVKTAFITLPQGMSRINVKLKAEQETEINAAGPAVDDGSLQALLRQTDTLQARDQLVLSGSLPAGLPHDLYRTVCRRAAARGVSVTVDATGALLTDALEARPFLIKPNRDELAEIAGRPLPDDAAVAAAAADLQRRGARQVLVSLGGDGALLLDETGAVHRAAAPAGRVLNSVGAGDSMVAGYLWGLSQTGDPREALRWGVAAGSATAFSWDLAEKAAVDALRGQVIIGQ